MRTFHNDVIPSPRSCISWIHCKINKNYGFSSKKLIKFITKNYNGSVKTTEVIEN